MVLVKAGYYSKRSQIKKIRKNIQHSSHGPLKWSNPNCSDKIPFYDSSHILCRYVLIKDCVTTLSWQNIGKHKVGTHHHKWLPLYSSNHHDLPLREINIVRRTLLTMFRIARYPENHQTWWTPKKFHKSTYIIPTMCVIIIVLTGTKGKINGFSRELCHA